MKNKIYANWQVGLLILTTAVLSLVLVQKAVFADWQAPSTDPGDNTGVNTPLVPYSGNVDVENNNIINVDDLRVETLTATTSITTLGSFTADSLIADDLTVNATLDVTATASEVDITAPNAVSIGSITKAGTFSSGMASSGGVSYGIYASTDASSGSFSNYAVAGISDNTGGVAIYGLGNSGWAGYFYGPVGITGAVTLGTDTIASGNYAVASGDSSEASGDDAVALGFATIASGTDSFAAGNESYATGFASNAQGMYATASGDFSTALGYSVIASGDYARALGANVNVSGANSVGIGLSDTVASSIIGHNVLAIVGGDVGIGVDPSYKFHLVGDYYQDGMMQI